MPSSCAASAMWSNSMAASLGRRESPNRAMLGQAPERPFPIPHFLAWPRRIRRQVRGWRWQFFGMFLDVLHHYFNRLLELRIAPRHDKIRPVVHFDVGRDAA